MLVFPKILRTYYMDVPLFQFFLVFCIKINPEIRRTIHLIRLATPIQSDEQRTNTLNEMLAEKEHLMEKCEAFQMEMERCQNDYRELAENVRVV